MENEGGMNKIEDERQRKGKETGIGGNMGRKRGKKGE